LTKALATFFSVCLAVTALWFYRKHQLSVEYDGYKQQGLQFVRSGDNQDALEPLGKYIRRYPSDPEVLIAYAQARQSIELPRQAHLIETMQILRRLLSIDPNHPAQRRQLLELYTKMGFTTEAMETAQVILEQAPNDSEALRCEMQCLLRLRREDEALRLANQWATVEPENIDPRELILWLTCDLQKNADGSVKIAEDWSAHHPNDAEYQTLQGFAYMLAHRPDEAKAALKAALARNPQNVPLVLCLVDKLDRLGLLEDSLNLLKRSADSTKDPAIRDMLVRRLWQAGMHADVVAELDKGISDDPNQRLEQLAIKAVSLRRLNRNADATAAIAQLTKTPGPLAVAWAMMPDYITDASADDLASRKMRDACLAALETDADAPYLRQCLAEADLQLGEAELAISIYRDIVMQHPAWLMPQARLTELLLSKSLLSEALDVAAAGLLHSSGNVVLAGIYARALDANIQHGLVADQNQLFDLVGKIQSAQPGEEASLPIYIRLLIEHGDKDKSVNALRNALAAAARPSEQALVAWAELSRSNGMGLEDACMARLEREYGITPTGAFNRAYGLYANGKPQEGVKLLDAMQSRAKPDARNLVLWRLAHVRYLDLINSPDAAAAWIKLSDDMPGTLLVQEGAIASPSNREQRDFLSRAIDRVRNLTGDSGETWRLARARWYMSSPPPAPVDWASSATLLQEVLRDAPDSIEARFLLAQCLEQQNNLPQALETLFAASRLEPDSRPIALYLAQLLQKSGDYISARQQLDRLTSMKMFDPEQRRRAAILLAQEGDAGKAVELLEDGKAQSRQEELLLANLYYHLHQLDRAQQLSTKLLANPDLDAITLAANLYAAMGQISDAQRVLKQLDQLKIDPDTRDLVLADFQSRYGDKGKSLELFQQATIAAPKNPDAWRALIAALLQRDRTADAMTAAQTALRANPGDPQLKSILAQQPLILAAMDNGLTPLAVGLIHSTDNQPLIQTITVLTGDDATRPARALAQLEQLANQYPGSLPVQLVVSERCIQMNRLDEAATIAGRAAEAFPQAPEPAKLSYLALARQGLWSQALGMARLWKQRATDDTESADCAIADALTHVNNNDVDALQQLQPYVGNSADADKNAEAIATYSLMLYQSHRSNEAEQLLFPLLPQHARLFSAWSQVVASALPAEFTSHALDQLIAAAPNPQANPFTQFTLVQTIDAVAARTSDVSHLPIADAICQTLEARTELSAGALTALADRRNAAGNWQSAEQLYRRAIAVGDPRGIAENNLACLLDQHDKTDEALTLALHNTAEFPNLANFRDTLAAIQRDQGKLADAAASERKAILLQPTEPKWRITYAELLLASGDRPAAGQAFVDWTDLRQTPPSNSPLALRVAHLQSQLKLAPPMIPDNPL
jgi:predicted Zn-dependent protease